MICEGDVAKIFDSEKVTKIYIGKDNHCRCGCGGEYVRRGDPKFNRRINAFIKKFWEYQTKPEDISIGEFVNVSYGNNRALTVYFK
jgi:hypothetical protein